MFLGAGSAKCPAGVVIRGIAVPAALDHSSAQVETWVADMLVHCCRAPDNPHQQIIKRLLALEGDTIIEDPKHGSWVEVPQVRTITSSAEWCSAGRCCQLALKPASMSGCAAKQRWICVLHLQGRCWVEGDNAAMSGDSKSAFGPVRHDYCLFRINVLSLQLLPNSESGNTSSQFLSTPACSSSSKPCCKFVQPTCLLPGVSTESSLHPEPKLAIFPMLLKTAQAKIANSSVWVLCRSILVCWKAGSPTLCGPRHVLAGSQCRSSQAACCIQTQSMGDR